jgi:hypothetical protein
VIQYVTSFEPADWYQSTAPRLVTAFVTCGNKQPRSQEDTNFPSLFRALVFSWRSGKDCLLLRLGDELVAYAADGENVTRLGGIFPQIPSEPDDEIVDGTRVGVFVQVPDIPQDRLARDGFAGVLK